MALSCRETSCVLCVLVVVMVPNYNCVPVERLALKWDFIAVAIRCFFFIIVTLNLQRLRLIGIHFYITHAAHRTHTPHLMVHVSLVFEGRTRFRLVDHASLYTQLLN